MSKHSKFRNIMHRKEAQDLKKVRVFTRISREIIVAVALAGSDPHYNPRLRNAITNAKKINLPKDRVEYAIKRGGNKIDETLYKEIRYEGYGPGGVGIMIETLTDNKNRTVSEIRRCFSAYCSDVSAQGGVSYLFDKVVTVIYQIPESLQYYFFSKVVELDVLDFKKVSEGYSIICYLRRFSQITNALLTEFGKSMCYKVEWRARSLIKLESPQYERSLKLIEDLDLLVDAQYVNHNLQTK